MELDPASRYEDCRRHVLALQDAVDVAIEAVAVRLRGAGVEGDGDAVVGDVEAGDDRLSREGARRLAQRRKDRAGEQRGTQHESTSRVHVTTAPATSRSRLPGSRRNSSAARPRNER